MAIVQISQIKNRRGVQADLPQLGSAELGWTVDTRKLYIGNGTLDEGAPEIGNTEILTEYSNLPMYTVYTDAISNNSTANLTYGVIDNNKPAVYLQYAIKRGDDSRVGWLKVARNVVNGNISYDEEYTETSNIGLTFNVTNISNTYAQLSATTSNLIVANVALSANLQYTVSTLSF